MPKLTIQDKTANIRHTFDTSLDMDFIQKFIDSNKEEQIEMLFELVDGMGFDIAQEYLIKKNILDLFEEDDIEFIIT